MPRSQFAGTWALVATEWRRADGRHANPFGQGAVGILMYDAAGFMSASVMHAERPPLPRDQPSGIDTAMASAVPGFINYFGSYDVDDDAGVVRHHVIGAAYPAWVGLDFARGFRFEGDTLVLTDDLFAADGVAVAASTTWRRLRNNS